MFNISHQKRLNLWDKINKGYTLEELPWLDYKKLKKVQGKFNTELDTSDPVKVQEYYSRIMTLYREQKEKKKGNK
jgi:hypothetical protein